MLKFLRKKTKTIVWSVIVAFVTWGGYAVSLQFQESNRSPGRVFGKEVTYREYLAAHRTVQFLGPKEPVGDPPTAEEIEARTWEFLALSHEARKQKIGVTDDEVRHEIENLLTAEGGKFPTRDQYLEWVRAELREEPREFENQVKETFRNEKLLNKARMEKGIDSEEKLEEWIKALVKEARVEVYQPQS